MQEHRTPRVLLTAGAAGPVIFIAAYLINGATQPGYSSWHDTISTLSLGRHGWLQEINFILDGVLTLCFAAGLRRSGAASRKVFALLVIAGLGLVIIGPVRTDPILGFPAGASDAVTAVGTVHSVVSLAVFLAFPAAIFAATRRPFRGWAAFSVACGVLSLVAVVAYVACVAAAKGNADGDSPAGLFERLPTLFIGLWQVAFAVRVLTRRASAADRGQPGRNSRRRPHQVEDTTFPVADGIPGLQALPGQE